MNRRGADFLVSRPSSVTIVPNEEENEFEKVAKECQNAFRQLSNAMEGSVARSIEVETACEAVSKRVSTLEQTVVQVGRALAPFDGIHLVGFALGCQDGVQPLSVAGSRWLEACGSEELARAMVKRGEAFPWGRGGGRSALPRVLDPCEEAFELALRRLESCIVELLLRSGVCVVRNGVVVPGSATEDDGEMVVWRGALETVLLGASVRGIALRRLCDAVSSSAKLAAEQVGFVGEVGIVGEVGVVGEVEKEKEKGEEEASERDRREVELTEEFIRKFGNARLAANVLRSRADGMRVRIVVDDRTEMTAGGLEMMLGALRRRGQVSVAAAAAAEAARRLGLGDLAPVASASVASIEAFGAVVAPEEGQGIDNAADALREAKENVYNIRIPAAKDLLRQRLERILTNHESLDRAAKITATTVLREAEVVARTVGGETHSRILESLAETLRSVARTQMSHGSLVHLSHSILILQAAPEESFAYVSVDPTVRAEARHAFETVLKRIIQDLRERAVIRAYEELVDVDRSRDHIQASKFPHQFTAPVSTPTSSQVAPFVQQTIQTLTAACKCLDSSSFRTVAASALRILLQRINDASNHISTAALPTPAEEFRDMVPLFDGPKDETARVSQEIDASIFRAAHLAFVQENTAPFARWLGPHEPRSSSDPFHTATSSQEPRTDLEQALREAVRALAQLMADFLCNPLSNPNLDTLTPQDHSGIALLLRRRWASLFPPLRWRIKSANPALVRLLQRPFRDDVFRHLTRWKVASPTVAKPIVAQLATVLDEF